MANDITKNPWVLVADGMIRTRPFFIKYAELIPATVGDTANLKHYDWSTSKSSESRLSITVTGNDTLTDTVATAAFATGNIAVGDAIRITHTSSGNNVGTYLVKTRTNDNVIVIDDGGLTNDTTEFYNFTIHTGVVFHTFLVSGVTSQVVPDKFYPPQPVTMQNLALDDLSASAKVYIYV